MGVATLVAEKTLFEQLERGEQNQYLLIECWLKEAMDVPVSEFATAFSDRIPLVNKYIKPTVYKGKSIPTEIIEFHGAFSDNLVLALNEILNNVQNHDQDEWYIHSIFPGNSLITLNIRFEKPLIKVFA